ncbi:MAG: PD-(D/E)XK nuclease family protein [Verrucomicrobiae bacterium]|nr:PD-(D/E)XK nuclease family protein [Verrucomicrobiae bacterium]
MDIEFLIGPAGSGKTHTCLEQIRAALDADPEGPPLLCIAPKQSTFQLERQILGLGVHGFTRLLILPFDRLARWLLAELGQPTGDTLSEEGRTMVLRALILEREADLRAFRTCARTAGFASQLSQVLRELHRAGAGPARLRDAIPAEPSTPGQTSLAAKLHDLALLIEAYRNWLAVHHLHDADHLLIHAAEALVQARRNGSAVPAFAGLWLDGFAEMTVPELNLLAAVLPHCAHGTLAFCLDHPVAPPQGEPIPEPVPGSLWTTTATTFLRCWRQVDALGLNARLHPLPDPAPAPRFRHTPILAHLASAWTRPQAPPSPPEEDRTGILPVECADPEAEALLAVRLIHRHVRQEGGRYRDISVILRRMDGYADVLQRAFRRHGIPFFADHREPMSHHPVAELTRAALHMAAGAWAHDDWLAALKSGLVVDPPRFVDQLENAALRHGLRDDAWLRPSEYRAAAHLSEDAVRCLEAPVGAFRRFRDTLPPAPTGVILAEALRELWAGLEVPETLDRWQHEATDLPPLYRAIHHTAWEQIQSWCSNLALAFATTELPLRDWTAIAEAGLSRLTLGIIPPALDQVLVGAVDRARQPNVRLTLVLGLNEGVFPGAPAAPALLHRADRLRLAEAGLDLGWAPLQQAAREQYFAYIACTRPSERLCVTWSRRGLDGKPAVRSSVAERLLALLGLPPQQPPDPDPTLEYDGRLRAFEGTPCAGDARSLSEWLECPDWFRTLPLDLPPGHPAELVARHVAHLHHHLLPPSGEPERRLAPETVVALHPDGTLTSSVSALEDFAECPFRHFARRQLRLGERPEFKTDPISSGNLLHRTLHRFHQATLEEKGRWRNWRPDEAAARIGQLGRELAATPEFAAFTRDPALAWETHRRLDQLGDAVGQMIRWMETCSFDPLLAEFRFGSAPDCRAGPWSIELPGSRTLRLQGSIDRLDVAVAPDGTCLVAVFDYKSSAISPSAPAVARGFELQLFAYLAFAAASPDLPPTIAHAAPLAAGGAFYVPLAPKVSATGRTAPDDERLASFRKSLTHAGRGNADWRVHFDSSPGTGTPRGSGSDQFKRTHFLPSEEFQTLLDNTVTHLQRHATAILDGTVGVLPVRYSRQKSACDHCPYRSVCRFEPLVGDFRSLQSPIPGPRS